MSNYLVLSQMHGEPVVAAEFNNLSDALRGANYTYQWRRTSLAEIRLAQVKPVKNVAFVDGKFQQVTLKTS